MINCILLLYLCIHFFPLLIPLSENPLFVGGSGGYKTSFITPSISTMKKIKFFYEEEVGRVTKMVLK